MMLAVWTVGNNSAAYCRLFPVLKGFVQHLSSNVLSAKAVIKKNIDKLKDHSSVSDHKANRIPSKDKVQRA